MSDFSIWIVLMLVGAFDVIGCIEWVKSVRTAVSEAIAGTGKKTTILWAPLSLLLSFSMALFLGRSSNNSLFGSLGNAVLFSGITMLSFVELFGYNVLVKSVFSLIDRLFPQSCPFPIRSDSGSVFGKVIAAGKKLLAGKVAPSEPAPAPAPDSVYNEQEDHSAPGFSL